MLFVLFALACNDSPDAPEPGYTDGVYECCAAGDGDTCCADAEVGTCFEYGGIYGTCQGDGELIEGKVICALCCQDLVAVEPMVETEEIFEGYPEGCGPGDAPPSLLVCLACGDGSCSAEENRCSCPEDC